MDKKMDLETIKKIVHLNTSDLNIQNEKISFELVPSSLGDDRLHAHVRQHAANEVPLLHQVPRDGVEITVLSSKRVARWLFYKRRFGKTFLKTSISKFSSKKVKNRSFPIVSIETSTLKI